MPPPEIDDLPDGDMDLAEAEEDDLPLGDMDYPPSEEDDLPPGDVDEPSSEEDDLPLGDVDINELVKKQYDCVGDGLNYISVLCGLAGVVGAAAGMGAGGIVAYAACAGAAQGLGQVSSDLAEDPPQPRYKRRARVRWIRPRRLPPNRNDHIKALNRVTRLALKATAVSRGMLDAMERLGGAKLARDRRWMKIHAQDFRAGARYSALLFRALNQRLRELAKVVAASGRDHKINHEEWKQIQQGWKRDGLPPSFRRTLHDLGMSRIEIDQFTKRSATFYRNRIKKSKLSYYFNMVSLKMKRVPGSLKRLS